MSQHPLPTGVVTFVLTDVEDSTGHWTRGNAAAAMSRHRSLITEAITSHGGRQPLEQGEGDSTVSVFADPVAALAATVDLQRALAAEPWPEQPVRVRVGINSGVAELVDEHTYGGPSIIRGARIRDLAHGGQVLVSGTTAMLTRDGLPAGVSLRTPSRVRLKGLDQPEDVHQLDHPDLAHAFPILRGEPPEQQLPTFLTSFIGREAEVASVGEQVRRCRLVTITGAGGSGKTRLAHRVAVEHEADHLDTVVWVDLTRVDSGASVAPEIAARCGLTESPGGEDAATALARHLSTNNRLVVLDNCEHLLDAVAAVVGTVLSCDGPSSILTTSREPLGLPGETVWRIPSLDLPHPDADLDTAIASSSVALFYARARSGRPDFALDPSTISPIVTICRRVDGLPLAIELAAARLRTMALDDLVSGLDDRFRLLAAGPRSIERQRTLVASIDWSHDLLDPDEQVLFRRLGVFAGPFELAAAEAIGADELLDGFAVFEILARLVDKSLLQNDDRGYSMLESIRQYAAAKAVDAGEATELRERHVRWFVDQVSVWGFERDSVTMDSFLAAERSLPDLRSAQDWATAADRVAASHLLWALSELNGQRCRFRELDDLAARACGTESEATHGWVALLEPCLQLLPLALTSWWRPPSEAVLADESLSPSTRRRLEFALLYLDLLNGTAGAADRAEGLVRAAHADDDNTNGAFGAVFAMAMASNGDVARAEAPLGWSERRYPSHVVTPFIGSVRVLVHVVRGEMAKGLDAVLSRPHQEVRPPLGFLADALVAAMAHQPSMLRSIQVECGKLEVSGAIVFVPHYLAFWSTAIEGQLDDALAEADQLVATVFVPARGATFRLYRANLNLARGDLEAAENDVRHAAALCTQIDHPLATSLVGLATAEIAHASGRTALAFTTAHRALDAAEVAEARWASIQILEHLGELAAAWDELDLAARLLGVCEAFRTQNRFAFRWPRPDSAIGALLPRLDPTHLEQGRALSIDDAVNLARGNRGPRGRPDFGWESLTPAEARVVASAAEGLSNRQIAEKTFTSLATVKTHLVHAYRKLGFDNRAQLIAAAIEHDRG